MEKKETTKKTRWRQYGALFWEFFKMGLFTIGGGMAMIPQLQQLIVKDKEWLTDEEIIDCIAVSQAMPGVIAINSATYIGYKVKGTAGSLAATLGVVTPSVVIIILAATLLDSIGENPYVAGAFTGIKAAVCGLILVTVVKLAKQSLHSPFQWILAITSVVAIAVFGITAVWAVVAGAILGIVYNGIQMKRADRDKGETP